MIKERMGSVNSMSSERCWGGERGVATLQVSSSAVGIRWMVGPGLEIVVLLGLPQTGWLEWA